jgi:hypothetical protein
MATWYAWIPVLGESESSAVRIESVSASEAAMEHALGHQDFDRLEPFIEAKKAWVYVTAEADWLNEGPVCQVSVQRKANGKACSKPS